MTIKRKITQADRDAAIRLKGKWREHKVRTGMTQSEAAKMMGYRTQGMVASYINCHVVLGVSATLKFAKLLGVSPLELRPDINELIPAELEGYLEEKYWRKCIIMTEATLAATGQSSVSGEDRFAMYMATYRIMQTEDFNSQDTAIVEGVVELITNKNK